jgi:DNA-binding MarR family transcriptional regulator
VGDSEFASALLRLSFAVQCLYHDLSREHDLTAQQALLMCALIERPVGMAELTEQLHIEKSTLTGLVDRAERRGLVRRAPHPVDRRVVRVALTLEGGEVVAGFQEAVTDALTDQLAHLPDEIQRYLRAALPPAATTYWERLG